MNDPTLKTGDQVDVPPEDVPELPEAEALVHSFLKALKGYRLYLPNNQILKGFVQAFHGGLTAFLREHDGICFRVSQYRIRYQGATVYENTAREESLAFRMFIHGIREFTFHEGVPVEEITDFLQAVHRAYDTATTVDDILTILWEKDLEYITFVILDDFFAEDEQSSFDEFMSSERRMSHAPAPMQATVQPILARLRAKSPSDEAGTGHALPDIIRLEEADLNRLRSLLEAEEARDLTRDLLNLVTEILALCDPKEGATEVLDILDQLLGVMIREGRVTEAARVVARLRRSAAEDPDGASLSTVEAALGRLDSRAILTALRPQLSGLRGPDRAVIVDFLSALGDGVAVSLIDLLDEPETGDIAMEVLRTAGPRYLDTILARLVDAGPRVATHIVKLVGEIGDASALPSLAGPLGHPDPRVRRETLKAVQSIGTAGAFPLVKLALTDQEPEVRVAAIRALGSLPTAVVRDLVLDLATSKDFGKRSFYEKKETLLALGAIDDEGVESYLVALLRKRKWFRNDGHDDLRACAVLALAKRGSTRAIKEIKACENDRSVQVKRAVTQALHTLPTQPPSH